MRKRNYAIMGAAALAGLIISVCVYTTQPKDDLTNTSFTNIFMGMGALTSAAIGGFSFYKLMSKESSPAPSTHLEAPVAINIENWAERVGIEERRQHSLNG